MRLPRLELAQSPAAAAALIQLLAVATACVQANYFGLFAHTSLTVLQLAALQGCIACSLALLLGCAPWWQMMHLAFGPALVLALTLELPPAVPLSLLLALIGIYWSGSRNQVPLYLSGPAAWSAVVQLLPARPGVRMIDLGSGLGGLVGFAARGRPDAHIDGIEFAPLPWLISRLRQWIQGWNVRIMWGDMWKLDFAAYDVVHAYLSPVPMPALWQKACHEMRVGGLLVSHSFPVPGVMPLSLRQLPDGRRIFVYRVGE